MQGRVLIVDDESATETLMRQVFRRELRAGGLDMQFARNGKQALELLGSGHPFQIVVTDINMPGLDGFGLLEYIQENQPQTRTIVASAYFDDKNLQRARERGANQVLNKPIDIGALRDLLQEWLAAH